MNKIIPGLVMATFSTAVLAQAQPVPGSQAPSQGSVTFQTLDKNSDQRISKTEASADRTVNQNFATLDANRDGNLSMAEFAAINPRAQ